MQNRIITIGLAPAWDRTIAIAGIEWNEHKVVLSQSIEPAGKALNINKALLWMGVESSAGGLWGSEDFALMHQALQKFKGVKIKFTKTAGRTRENITLVDTKNKRQMHLRSTSTLANPKSLKALQSDLRKIIRENSFAVFAGAMPKDAVAIVELAKQKGANVVVDTSGAALKEVVSQSGLLLIKPNVEELSELVGRKIKNKEKEIIAACKKLLTKVKMILVSRGEKGAMLICSDYILCAGYTGRRYDVCNTVACGDYLLAGFLSVIAAAAGRVCVNDRRLCMSALDCALKSATAKAFDLNKKFTWRQVRRKLKTQIFTV